MLISSHPFTLSIYHILDFWCKIRFRKHIFIIQGQMHPLKNFHKKMTLKGGGRGVNPYGQPDRKKTVIFFDDFPKYHVHINIEGRMLSVRLLPVMFVRGRFANGLIACPTINITESHCWDVIVSFREKRSEKLCLFRIKVHQYLPGGSPPACS